MDAQPAAAPSISSVPMGALKQTTLFNMPEVKEFNIDEHNKKVSVIRKANLDRRNLMIRNRFDHLYNTDRLRVDDCIEKLCGEFSLAKSTIESVLKG